MSDVLIATRLGEVARLSADTTPPSAPVSVVVPSAAFKRAVTACMKVLYGSNDVAFHAVDGDLVVSSKCRLLSFVIPGVVDRDVRFAVGADGKALKKLVSGRTATVTFHPDHRVDVDGLNASVGGFDVGALRFGDIDVEPFEFSVEFAACAVKASTDLVRSAICAVNVEYADGGVRFVSTDSYTLRVRAFGSLASENGGWPAAESNVLVPAALLTKGMSAFGVSADREWFAAVNADGFTMIGQTTVHVEFPKWQQFVANRGDETVTWMPNGADVRKRLRTVATATKDDRTPVQVWKDDCGRVKYTLDQIGVGVSDVFVSDGFDIDAETFVTAFNPSFLADVLDQHDGGVEMRTVNELSPAVFPHQFGFDLLMPCRVM